MWIIHSIILVTSALRLLGRFATYCAQTTTAKRLLFASTRHFVPRSAEKSGNRLKFFLYPHDDVIF